MRRRSCYAAEQTPVGTAAANTGRTRFTDVYLPAPDSHPSPEWVPIPGLGQLFETIFRTAQNYRDNMQAMLPSYRERIIQIHLTDHEGGLNLDMSPTDIPSPGA